MINYDRIYYYTGGTELGKWHEIWYYNEDTLERIRRMGYHCVKGVSTIGMPEGPPSKDKLQAALNYSISHPR